MRTRSRVGGLGGRGGVYDMHHTAFFPGIVLSEHVRLCGLALARYSVKGAWAAFLATALYELVRVASVNKISTRRRLRRRR